jgi:glycosyl transferase family 25
MKIFVINLKRASDRLIQFEKNNPGLRYTVAQALDGESLDEKVIRKIMPIKVPTYTRGAIGCYYSHILLWERVVQENVSVTICEDDAVLAPDFESLSEELLNQLGNDWDIVLWGWNMNSVLHCDLLPGLTSVAMQFDNAKFQKNLFSYLHQPVKREFYRLFRAFGTPCYSISPRGAKAFLEKIRPPRPMQVYFPILKRKIVNTGIDIMMNAHYPNSASFVCFQPLALTPNDVQFSTVQTRP